MALKNLTKLVVYVDPHVIDIANREVAQRKFKGLSEFFRHIIALGITEHYRILREKAGE